MAGHVVPVVADAQQTGVVRWPWFPLWRSGDHRAGAAPRRRHRLRWPRLLLWEAVVIAVLVLLLGEEASALLAMVATAGRSGGRRVGASPQGGRWRRLRWRGLRLLDGVVTVVLVLSPLRSSA